MPQERKKGGPPRWYFDLVVEGVSIIANWKNRDDERDDDRPQLVKELDSLKDDLDRIIAEKQPRDRYVDMPLRFHFQEGKLLWLRRHTPGNPNEHYAIDNGQLAALTPALLWSEPYLQARLKRCKHQDCKAHFIGRLNQRYCCYDRCKRDAER